MFKTIKLIPLFKINFLICVDVSFKFQKKITKAFKQSKDQKQILVFSTKISYKKEKQGILYSVWDFISNYRRDRKGFMIKNEYAMFELSGFFWLINGAISINLALFQKIINSKRSVIHRIVERARQYPFYQFQDLNDGDFPVVRATLEDPQGLLKNEWIASYANKSVKFSLELSKFFTVHNPLNSSEVLKVKFTNYNNFNPEIVGYQLLSNKIKHGMRLFLGDVDTKRIYKNYLPNSPQFFSFDEVFISGKKVCSAKDGEYIEVNHIFQTIRDNFSEAEVKQIWKYGRLTLVATGIFTVLTTYLLVILHRKKRAAKNIGEKKWMKLIKYVRTKQYRKRI